jgi:hypothetical protein
VGWRNPAGKARTLKHHCSPQGGLGTQARRGVSAPDFKCPRKGGGFSRTEDVDSMANQRPLATKQSMFRDFVANAIDIDGTLFAKPVEFNGGLMAWTR